MMSVQVDGSDMQSDDDIKVAFDSENTDPLRFPPYSYSFCLLYM